MSTISLPIPQTLSAEPKAGYGKKGKKSQEQI